MQIQYVGKMQNFLLLNVAVNSVLFPGRKRVNRRRYVKYNENCLLF